MKNSPVIKKDILIAILGGLTLGAILSFFSPGNFWLGWLGMSVLSALITFGTLRVWRALGTERSLAVIMIVTFLIRMIVGVFLTQGLPIFGYENPVQQAGYVFSDAADRDQAAFHIAASGGVFKHELSEFKAADQYGGLLALSALLYQVFSSDAHRPLLMVMVSAFAMSLGLAFLFSGVVKKWGQKVAVFAAWVYALYPDSILLGSSQMREPILIGLSCLLFWIGLQWKQKPVRILLYGLLVTLVTCLFSVPAGGASFTIVAGIVFLEWLSEQQNKRTRFIAIAIFTLFLLAVAIAGWLWLKEVINFEFYMTRKGSGWITKLYNQYGKKYLSSFLSVYGLTQPLLPAALIDPSIPLWKSIAIFRAAGWYAVIPYVVYGMLSTIKSKDEEHKVLLIFISIAFAAWILISSMRGGGDQWDNPRYRITFLPWMSILIGWTCQHMQNRKNPWFWRIVAMECTFVLFFLNWYINRQFGIGTQLPFHIMVILILGIIILIVAGGFIWDLIKNRRKSPVVTQK